MYKYMVDYLGGELAVEHSNTKRNAVQKIKAMLYIKPYLVARLKMLKPSYKHGYDNYVEIARYELKFDRKTGKHKFVEV